MPYVTQGTRKMLDSGLAPSDVGGLTYVFYKEAMRYLNNVTEPRYADFATVIAALEAAKLEFYRRHVANYEDEKIRENGDVT
jgi:hypothetical protein